MTPLIAFGGGFVSLTCFAKGSPVLGSIFLMPAVTSILIWLRVRWAALVLLAYFATITVFGIISLINDEFTTRKLFRCIATSFLIHEVWVWYRLVGYERQAARMQQIWDAAAREDVDWPDPAVENQGVDDHPVDHRSEPARGGTSDDPFGDRWRDAT